jgi:hypothetical protein
MDLVAQEFDMTTEPRQEYRLSLAQFESMPVPETQAQLRQRIYDLEAMLFQKQELENIGLEQILEDDDRAQPDNLFTDGIYVRKLVMPAGTFVVAKRHAQEHVCIISQGRATVVTEKGRQEIKAPMHFISPAGTKRVVLVHEDMVWTTIHRTDKTDLKEIEAELIIKEPARAIALQKGEAS